MHISVIAERTCLGDLLGAGLDAAVAVPGQRLGVALSGHDVADEQTVNR
jgi:hypothetical protein